MAPTAPALPLRGRAFLWLLTRTLWTRRDTPRNRARCSRSRFVWGTPPGRRRLHLRVLGLVNGFMPDGYALTLLYDDVTGRPIAADVRPLLPDGSVTWGEQTGGRAR